MNSTGFVVEGDTGNVGIGVVPTSTFTVSNDPLMSYTNGGLPAPVVQVGARGANPNDGLGIYVEDTTSGYIGWVGAIRSGSENCSSWGCKTLRFNVPNGTGNPIEAMAIKGTTGNVGIGELNPSTKLEVNGTITATAYAGDGSGLSNIDFDIVNDTTPQLGGNLDVNGFYFSSAAGMDFAIGASAGNDFTVDTNKLVVEGDTGRVGIGTATPVARLHVKGNFANDGTGGFALDASDTADPEKYILRINPFVVGGGRVGYQFETKSATGGTQVPLTFSNDGRVGIGTTNTNAGFQVGDTIDHDGGRVYDPNAIMVSHPTPTSNTTLNDPEEVLYLVREGTSGEAYGAMATFKLSRYEDSSTNSRTRLDLDLTNGSFTDTNAMTFLSGGFVGMGTTSPQNNLHINRNTGNLGAGILLTRSDTDTRTNESLGGIYFDATDNQSSVDASAIIRASASEYHTATEKGAYISFLTKSNGTDENAAATEKVRIDDNGLDVFGAISATNLTSNQLQGNQTTGGSLFLTRNDSAVTAGELLGEIKFEGSDGGYSSVDSSVAIRAISSETQGSGDKGGILTFLTKDVDTDGSAAATEKMRIDDSGVDVTGDMTATNSITAPTIRATDHFRALPSTGETFGVAVIARNDGTTNGGNVFGEIKFDSTDGGLSTVDAPVLLRAIAAEGQGTSNKGGSLLFLTKDNGVDENAVATEKMRIDNSGVDVIGTVTATTKVDSALVEGDVVRAFPATGETFGVAVIARNDGTTNGGNVFGEIKFDSTDGGLSTVDAPVLLRAIAAEGQGTSNKGGSLLFLTKDNGVDENAVATEKMRIDNSGVDVIGTVTATTKVDSALVEGDVVRAFPATGDTAGVAIIARNDSSTDSGNLLGEIKFDSTDGGLSTVDASAVIRVFSSETHSNLDKGGRMSIYTKNIDTDENAAATEKLRIDDGGLDVYGTMIATGRVDGDHFRSRPATGGLLDLSRNDGSTNTSEILGEIKFDSNDGGYSSVDSSVAIRAIASEEHGSGDKGGYLSFVTKSVNVDANAAATERMRIDDGGVDITGNIEATGQATASQNVIASGATVNFNTGNVQVLENVGTTAITLNNMRDGGAYTLIITDGTSRTYTFTNCTNTHQNPAAGPTMATKTTIFNILKVTISSATHCYINWMTGY